MKRFAVLIAACCIAGAPAQAAAATPTLQSQSAYTKVLQNRTHLRRLRRQNLEYKYTNVSDAANARRTARLGRRGTGASSTLRTYRPRTTRRATGVTTTASPRRTTTRVRRRTTRRVPRATVRTTTRRTLQNPSRTTRFTRRVEPNTTARSRRSRTVTNVNQIALVLQYTNAEREKAGLDPLKENTLLKKAAQLHAVDMETRNFLSHDNPSGESIADRVRATGYQYVKIAENIAKGQSTARDAVQDWMESPSHKVNILDPDFDEIGIGFSGYSWVQNFGKSKSSFVAPANAIDQVFNLVNDERELRGLDPLRHNSYLEEAAATLALDMKNNGFVGSTNPQGITARDRIQKTGYFTSESGAVGFIIAENIANGGAPPAFIVQEWMRSEHHKSNILDSRFKDTGIAILGTLWVQTFGALTEDRNAVIEFSN